MGCERGGEEEEGEEGEGEEGEGREFHFLERRFGGGGRRWRGWARVRIREMMARTVYQSSKMALGLLL